VKALSILGTSSGAGKSWIATAFCAWLRREGVRVAPFKAQNMSNNASATPDGGEIARAQAVQAEACGLPPEPAMNPILLKPSGRLGSQLVLNGRAQGHLAAIEYYRDFDRLWSLVAGVLDGWRTRCDVLVMEGAGSPVECDGRHWSAYEIHMGRTESLRLLDPLNTVWEGDRMHDEGVRCGLVWGTYLHGWFEAPELRRRVATAAGLTRHRADPVPWGDRRQGVYAQMADHLVGSVNLAPMRRYLGI
jgi:cobyric acid synthase